MSSDAAFIRSKVEELRAATGDPERAHILEDRIHHTALEMIARKRHTSRYQRAIATEAMKTEDIEFERWSA